VDDDGNGFVDDVSGWDFTDAPNFSDGGDYLQRDNEPFDENGHGTAVAGIISAVADNHIGVAGLAPGCRIMAVRAGNSQGLLEEDDVASAIVYAVTNGASVINMSFGDVIVSPMLLDVVRFAHRRGVVLVAAAGNAASSAPHYPAGFAETISVGASTVSDQLASFSNYGATVDVVAPGEDIWTTKIGKTYAPFSGTSAAAPFVSALAGLIRSRSPEWKSEMVRAALQNSAIDLGESGWDQSWGAGRIDAAIALQTERVARAEIHAPQMNDGFAATPGSERAVIRGTALGAFSRATHCTLVWTTIPANGI
jgi:subtilisin family serine protease